MPEFLVSAATGALKAVLEKLASVLGEEYKRFKGVRGEIKSLADELAAMHAFLLKMSDEENPDEQDKAWMKEVRELSYDIEDCLDTFMLRVDDKSVKPDGFVKKCKTLLSKVKTQHKIGKAIHDLKDRVNEVGQRHARYRTATIISDSTSKATVDRRALAIFEDSSKLVGIDGPKQELIKLLAEENGSVPSKKPKLISIVGPGGLGKTTLVNQVYQELRGQFQCNAFVSVSRDPDITKVLRIILSEVSREPYGSTEAGDIQQLIGRISTFLENKRYLIVVDDVWSAEAWKIIRCIFLKSSDGSKVIMTTRINEVAKACCSSDGDRVYTLKPLNEMDSRQLFHNRIFGSGECPSHLHSVSAKILRKCGGLPLAIIAISSLLANKAPTADQWDQVETSIGSKLERNKDIEHMMSVLSMSYFDLPHSIKSCLLYLSIFPEDHEIEKERLIMRWIAEGFIAKQHGFTVYELGENCFNELINRSLIQPGWINELSEVGTCRVHDTILDFIVSKAKEENFVTLLGLSSVNPESQDKVRRLALHCDHEIPSNLVLCNARSLTSFSYYMQVPPLLEFRHLRVLDFEGCMVLEYRHLQYICSLFHLKYLNLKDTHILGLPEQIGELGYLETLNVDGTLIHEIPSTTARLQQLVHLFVDRYAKLPDGIGGMQSLQVLRSINVFMKSIHFVEQIGLLTNLRTLGIHFDTRYADAAGDYKDECMKTVISSIHKLVRANLHSLCISADDSVLAEVFLESWCPAAQNILKLHVWCCEISRVPTSMVSLDNLQKLVLPLGEIDQQDMVILGRLPALFYLFLRVGNGRVVAGPEGGRLSISRSHWFPSLRHFRIGGRKCALGLIFEQESMPKLQKLDLEFDPDVTYLLTNGDFDFGVEHLSSLTSVSCRISHSTWDALEDTTKIFAKSEMERAISGHPNHPTFTMH
ncbi:hypothetical protein ACP4OV_024512 [Aristida adscensionis]